MAIYRLSIKIVKEHVSTKVAYIERQGKYSKGTKAEELRESWSSDMPTWAAKSQDFWKAIELGEKPGNVQARGIELALPVELNKDEQKAIVQEFSDTVLKKHARTIAIHDSKDGKNPHVHIYFCERTIDDRPEPTAENYCKKQRGYKKEEKISGKGRQKWLKDIRKTWENIQNDALLNCEYVMNGGEILQVSAASLEDQGVTREAQIHVGYQDINRYRKTGEKGARYKRNEAILERNRAYSVELSAAQAEVKRLEKAVKEERQAKEEAARKAAEAAKKAEEAQRIEAARKAAEAARKAEEARKNEVERRRLEAEAARRAADDEARKEKEAVEATATAKEQSEKQPEPTAPERWISDEIMHQIAGTWFNAKHFDHDTTAMKTVISRVMPGKIDFSRIAEKDQERLCKAAMAVLGQIRRGAHIKTEEAGKRVFSEILAGARVPEREPEITPEHREPEQRQSKPEITKTKQKEKNRGFER